MGTTLDSRLQNIGGMPTEWFAPRRPFAAILVSWIAGQNAGRVASRLRSARRFRACRMASRREFPACNCCPTCVVRSSANGKDPRFAPASGPRTPCAEPRAGRRWLISPIWKRPPDLSGLSARGVRRAHGRRRDHRPPLRIRNRPRGKGCGRIWSVHGPT